MSSWVAGRPAPLMVVGPAGVDKLAAGFNLAYENDHEFRRAHHEHDGIKVPIATGLLQAKVVTIAKRAPASTDGLSGDELQAAQAKRVHAFRRARRWVMDADALGKLFNEYAIRFAARQGGYTRIVKAVQRAARLMA